MAREIPTFDTEDLLTLLDKRGYHRRLEGDLQRLLANDDTRAIAIYQNVEIGHPDGGALRFFPIPTDDRLFDVSPEVETVDDVPVRLPDFDGQINWRYQLIGFYRKG